MTDIFDTKNISEFINIIEILLVHGLVLVLFCQSAVALIRTHGIKNHPPPEPKPSQKKMGKGADKKRVLGPQKES